MIMNKNSLRIAMLGHKRMPSHEGGIEIVVEELATRMVNLGHRVTCYNRMGHHVSGKEYDTDTQKCSEYKGVRIRHLPTISYKGLAAVSSSFFGCLFTAFGKYDIVHIHAEGPAAFCWIPRLLGKHVVLTIHGLDWARAKWQGSFASTYIKFAEKMGVKFANKVIVLNEHNRQYFKDTYGLETQLIPNGVSQAHTELPDLITKKFGLEKDGYILYLGRIVPEKGGHYLCDAYKNVETDKKLVIAGGSSDSEEYFNELKAASADDKRIVFTGFVDGKLRDELFSNAYAFVLPSDLEGMSLSLLEAMSYGNCVITSDIKECTDVTEGNGFVFRHGSVKGLQKILQYVCDNPDIVKINKKHVAEFIQERYNWDDVVSRTLDVYKEIL